jgi:hypothetical protein
MKDSDPRSLQNSPQSTAPHDTGFSPWQRLKTLRISYLTLPLLVMATITEFVILATGWKYQQVVCVPQGMGVTFFGIGPIGATILACELLKLPLAIWTASRRGWQKIFMLCAGLPCICILTFQLVKDMAVYEMGVAMTPATQMLEKATAEETRITELNGQLAAIEQKKADREKKLADLSAKEAQAKADLEASLKRNEDIRHDAVSLTDYQKKELADVDNRESAIIMQFNADTAQINKALADLRANREVEVGRNAKWNAEQARIDNEFNGKMTEYSNAKAAYDKAKAAYDNAGFIKRKLMREPVSPGVPPEREVNKIFKPTSIADIDAQITAKEAELTAVNNKRRDRIAQIEADTRTLREQYDTRSITKREQADKKRDELAQAEVALSAEWKAERKQIDEELAAAVQKVDGIHAQLAVAQKNAEGYYEAREADIRKTQVHRIATTVEIVRGLIKGERPMSIKMTAKQRGDILTDQISMVRIWVYPVLAFIVAFLPTLMVEIGFSTVFQPDNKQLREHRFGLFGRQLYWVCVRAGRQKIAQTERLTREAQTEVANRSRALVAAKTASDQALAEKDLQLHAASEAAIAAAAAHEEQLKARETEYAELSKRREEEWLAKFAGMADTLNRTVVEKDTLRDTQKSEVERQVQNRQKLWTDRIAQLSQELADHRASSEAERVASIEEHHKRLTAISDESKAQVSQLRRQLTAAESAANEKTARLTQELQQISSARETAESQLKEQVDSLSLKLAQAQDTVNRETEKAARREKQFIERQQLELEKKVRQREDALEEQFRQRELELSASFDTRLAEEKSRIEADARLREAERGRQLATRSQESDAYWNQEIQKRDEVAQAKLKLREQQLLAQADARVREIQVQIEEQARQRQLEFERQLEAQSRASDARTAELLKQREQQWQAQTEARVKEAQSQAEARLQARHLELERQRQEQSRDTEVRYRDEVQQKESQFQARLNEREREWTLKADARAAEMLKQREQQWHAQAEARLAEMQAEAESRLQERQAEFERQHAAGSRAAETRLREELQKREVQLQAKLKEREQELTGKADARIAELQRQSALELTARQEDLERRAEERVAAAESRLAEESRHKEELLQSKVRQRDQQWQAKLEATQAEYQAQSEETIRRRSAEADTALRALEARLHEEMKLREMALQANAMQHEQEAIAQVRTLWDAESEAKIYAAMESFRAMLDRTEKERDEARQSALEGIRRVETLEKKLTEASSFFSSWRNGGNLTEKA